LSLEISNPAGERSASGSTNFAGAVWRHYPDQRHWTQRWRDSFTAFLCDVARCITLHAGTAGEMPQTLSKPSTLS
jgi:hypothetical protein